MQHTLSTTTRTYINSRKGQIKDLTHKVLSSSRTSRSCQVFHCRAGQVSHLQQNEQYFILFAVYLYSCSTNSRHTGPH